jgi:DNA-binding NtrC family response regulator
MSNPILPHGFSSGPRTELSRVVLEGEDISLSSGFAGLVPSKSFGAEGAGASSTGRETRTERSGGRILIVDDDESMCALVESALQRMGHEVTSCTSASDAVVRASDEDFDVIVTDLNMGSMSGLELCERVVGTRPDVPVVVVTGHGSMESAVAAIRAGAYDFITKPVDMKMLSLTLARALQQRRLRDEVKRLRQAVGEGKRFGKLVGASPAIRRVHDLVTRVADSDASVLITGESGTGKELVARAIHERSPRKEGAFVALNCAAMPPALLESELFGHTRGAFTDAKSSRVGLFVQASAGTIFLDEIGELPLDVQPKLLRALQERKVRPVGGNIEMPFDARIVAATNRDLETEVDEKRFREDLFYRINVVKIEVPPLRERGNDILVLAQHFVERFTQRRARGVMGIATAAAEKLVNYEWPGNVRELENCIERAIALTHFDQITVEDLPEKIRDYRANRLVLSADDATELVSMDELERRYILRVMSLVGGNKSRAAEVLGFDRRTLYRKLERYERARA